MGRAWIRHVSDGGRTCRLALSSRAWADARRCIHRMAGVGNRRSCLAHAAARCAGSNADPARGVLAVWLVLRSADDRRRAVAAARRRMELQSMARLLAMARARVLR